MNKTNLIHNEQKNRMETLKTISIHIHFIETVMKTKYTQTKPTKSTNQIVAG